MCVIIYRKPSVEIPFDKLKSACLVNADGMGLIAVDRGKLELRKHFTGKGNDPETLSKFFEDTKDLHVYAHLRYRTKGSTDKSNVHPFGVLKKAKHGIDLQFMHNGTLSDFGTDADCDSKHFAKSFLTPLTERFLKSIDPNLLLHDDIYATILEKYAGKGSVFLLADNLGNHRIVNYDKGKEFEGWWASNEYSFNRWHREKDEGNRYYSSSYGYRSNYYRDTVWKEDGRSPQTEEKKVITLPAVPADTGGTAADAGDSSVPFDTAKAEAKVVVTEKKVALPKRETFCEIAGISSLSDLVGLAKEEIADMVDDYPDHAVLLIQDLLKELYDREQEYDDDPVAEERAA